MAAAAILNCYFVILDHTKSTSWPKHRVKISHQLHYCCQSYGHLIILQNWLKTLISAPKIYVLGGFDIETP